MRIHEKRIVSIRLICIRELLAQHLLLVLGHRGQLLTVLPVQAVVPVSQAQAHEDLEGERRHDGCFAADVAGCFFGLEGFGVRDVARTVEDERRRVDSDLFGVPAQVGCVPD